ncbi:UNVERIFIED_CONTAM: hypothetical protein Sangu_2953500 [Sesamum angustifolium]|uniref:Uncharacterized protein n=1 Tax=Sesamum angustifolium TaxID=2727405 RepID=A0AAW2IJU8_9LAMI
MACRIGVQMGSRFFLLVFLVFLAIPAIAAGRRPSPGFLYTRTRGRCTPQYWSSRRERYREDLTLLEAAARNDDGKDAFARLVKQSTAALLNSYARKGYPYAAWEVKTLLIQALVSERAAAFQAQKFLEANENCG